MQKTLRIFQKDMRHLWPEILLTLGITFGFATSEHYLWPGYTSIGLHEAQTQLLIVWMNILMPVAWWLLIGRAVHDEPLVGDVQFWVTRPYGWQRLLSAKLLFLALFIVLPFFLAQCFLLHQAGLHATAVLPGLLLKLFLISAWMLLPLLALSTVTPSLTRMILIFLALIVYISFVGYLTRALGSTPPSWVPGNDDPIWGWCAIVLIPVVAAVVTLLQYARRRTSLSCGLLIALVVVLTVAGIGAIYSRGDLHQFSELVSNETAPVQVAFNADPASQVPQAQRTNPAVASHLDFVPLTLPLTLSGIAPGHAIRIDGRSLAYEATGIPQTKLPWEQDGNIYAADPGAPQQQIRQMFGLPRDAYLKIANKPLNLHLTYAVTEFEALSSHSVTYTGASFDLPEQGRCNKVESSGEISCLYAIRRPSLTRVTWMSHPQGCENSAVPGTPKGKWIGSEGREGYSYLGFNPVVAMDSIFEYYGPGSHPDPDNPCPGSVITFTRYRVVRHRLSQLTLPPIDTQSYILPPRDSDSDE